MPLTLSPEKKSETPVAPQAVPDVYPQDYSADFRRLWHAFLERSWIVLIALVICVGLGFAYIRRAPVLYSSTATILVEQEQAPVFRIDNVNVSDLRNLDFLQTVVQSLRARPLLERVAESNNLATDPRFSKPSEKVAPTAGGMMVTLENAVAVKLRRGTRLIDVTVTHSSPELAERVANSLIAEYSSEKSERHVTSAEGANEALLKEAERLKKKLQDSENALQEYRENSKASSLENDQNTVVATLRELSTKVTDAKSMRIKLESDYQQVLSFGTNIEGLLTLPSVANNPTVVAAGLSLSRAENDFAALRQRYKEKHPKYIQTSTQIKSLQAERANAVMKAADGLKASLEGARASEEALASALKNQEDSALALGKLSIQYGVLAREVESDRALYDSVPKSLKETSVNKEMEPTRIRVVQPAYRPEKPVSPKKPMIMAMSAMAGLFLGFLGVLGISFIDSSVKTVDEAESLLCLPVLATVALMKSVRKGKNTLVVLEDSKSAGAEAFRTLRTGLSMLGKTDDRRVFLFTSAMPQEGKTFCSLNYAASLAQTGLRTLLIDGDLRRPTVESTLLGTETESPGVTDYLTSKKAFAEVVQPTKLENLFIISGGSTAPNPAELLAQDGLDELIHVALKEFDRVVVDSAPIHAVSDTLLMLKSVQTVCLVVRAAYTPSRSVLRCVQLLQGAQAPLSGVILNRMPIRRGVGYGYYAPYYEYGYRGKYSKKGVYGAK